MVVSAKWMSNDSESDSQKQFICRDASKLDNWNVLLKFSTNIAAKWNENSYGTL